jgi:hypothetical protein
LAQSNVYSLNVVGYINVPLVAGFNLIANPLDLDGTGLNNTITSNLGTNWPNLTRAFGFNVDLAVPAFQGSTFLAGAWNPNTKIGQQSGGGFFLSVASAGNVTFVGNVLQGSLTNRIVPGFQLVSSQVPQEGTITGLGYVPGAATPQVPERVFTWLPATQSYQARQYNGTSWVGSEPYYGTNFAGLGEAKWLFSPAGGKWTRNFTVN